MATAVKLLMADSSMDMTAIQIVNDQRATMDATMEEITTPMKVRIDTEAEIVNPWAVSAGNEDPERTFQERVTQPTNEWLGQAYELHGIPEEHQVQDGDTVETPAVDTPESEGPYI